MVARLRVRDSTGVVRTILRARGRDATGVVRTLQRIRVRDASGILRTVFQYLTATTVPIGEVTGSYNGSSAVPQNITTASATVDIVGGVGPFTYAWSQVGVSPYAFSANSPTAATTSFTGTAIDAGSSTEAFFKCTVTDASGNVVETNVIQVSVFNNSTA